MTFGDLLTAHSRTRKVVLMPDALSILLSQSLGGLSVREAAELCHLPPHRLRDIIYKRVKRPDEDVLKAIELGLGVPYERLALAAYGIIHDPVLA